MTNDDNVSCIGTDTILSNWGPLKTNTNAVCWPPNNVYFILKGRNGWDEHENDNLKLSG